MIIHFDFEIIKAEKQWQQNSIKVAVIHKTLKLMGHIVIISANIYYIRKISVDFELISWSFSHNNL